MLSTTSKASLQGSAPGRAAGLCSELFPLGLVLGGGGCCSLPPETWGSKSQLKSLVFLNLKTVSKGGGRVFRSKFNLFALSCWMLIITKLHVGSSGALITLLLVLNGFHWADAM